MGSFNGLSPYCWAWNKVYVKSNGRVPCWCDTGEVHTIVQKNLSEVDFVHEIVNSPEMRRMRTMILQDQEYYIKECGTCTCMTDSKKGEWFRHKDGSSPDYNLSLTKIRQALEHMHHVQHSRGWEFGSIDVIEEIQIEPSFLCSLKCPGCLQGTSPDPLKTESAPYILKLDWLQNMISSLYQNNIKIKHITFVGRGEPTLNQALPEMLKRLRFAFPDTFMVMDTNSNQRFKDEYLHLSQINCSIDGANPETYPIYRAQGKLAAALDFMETAVKRKKALNAKTAIVWKYILFDTTDDDEQLKKAQQLAKDIGVDKLEFVITHCGGGPVSPSKRFQTFEILNSYLESRDRIAETGIRRN